jgi:photosystem II stability/assembly factor-like uncharacterized protein
MRMRPVIPAGLLLLVAVCGLVQGCGGLAEQGGARHARTPGSAAGRPGVENPLAPRAATPHSASSGQVVGRFLVSVKPDQGTMTIEAESSSGAARVALRPYGPEDALKLTSSGVAFNTTTKLLSGDVKIVSSHPLPLYDTRIVIDSMSTTSVTAVLDSTKGDGNLPQNGRPFYFYGTVPAGATTTARKWSFQNPSGVSFTFVVYVWANVWLPTAGDGNSITAISFPTRNNGWAAGDQGKMLATTDGGLTWSGQNIRAGMDFKDVFFISVDTGFACGSSETILRTTNRGRAWKMVRTNTDVGAGRLNSIFFLDGQRGWAVGDQGVLLITTNGGDTWQRLVISSNSLNVVRFVSPTIGWAVGLYGTLLKTTDGGQTWTQQTLPNDMPFPASFTHFQGAAFLDASNGVVVGSQGTILRTANGGSAWSVIPLPAGLSGTGLNLLGIAFADTKTGWVVGSNGTILKTTNAGLSGSWTRQTSSTTLTLQAIATPRNQTSFACVGAAAGTLFTTINGGSSWTKPGNTSGTASQLNAVDWLDLNRGMAVGMNGTILKTTDGGKTWVSRPWVGGQNLNDVTFVTETIGYACGSVGTILKTTDGGTNWTQQASGYTGGDLPTATLRGIRFPDLNVGWACGSNGLMLKTTNGGSTWTKTSFPISGVTLEKLVWIDPQNGWVCYSSNAGGGIYRTSNGGGSWVGQHFTSNEGLNALRMFGPEAGYLGFAVGEKGMILRTTNGTSWTRMTVPSAVVDTTFYGVDFSDTKNGWVVGDGGTVLQTANGGTTWTLIDPGTNRNLYDVFFWEVDTGWVVGSQGTIRRLN